MKRSLVHRVGRRIANAAQRHRRKLQIAVGAASATFASQSLALSGFTPATFDGVTFPVDIVSIVLAVAGAIGTVMVLVWSVKLGSGFARRAARETTRG